MCVRVSVCLCSSLVAYCLKLFSFLLCLHGTIFCHRVHRGSIFAATCSNGLDMTQIASNIRVRSASLISPSFLFMLLLWFVVVCYVIVCVCCVCVFVVLLFCCVVVVVVLCVCCLCCCVNHKPQHQQPHTHQQPHQQLHTQQHNDTSTNNTHHS